MTPHATNAWFVTTRWSVVLAAGVGSTAALEELCQSSWPAVYAYLRRSGDSPPDARDHAQGYFAWLLANGVLAQADPAKGRFRSFLLGALKHWLSAEHTRASALKRGGGCRLLSIEALAESSGSDQARWEPSHTHTPAYAFDRAWARGVFERAMDRLRAEQQAAGRGAEFGRLRECLLGDKAEEGQAALAVALGVSTGALRVALHRLRGRFLHLLRLEVAQTVRDPWAVDDELRHLADILRS